MTSRLWPSFIGEMIFYPLKTIIVKIILIILQLSYIESVRMVRVTHVALHEVLDNLIC